MMREKAFTVSQAAHYKFVLASLELHFHAQKTTPKQQACEENNVIQFTAYQLILSTN